MHKDRNRQTRAGQHRYPSSGLANPSHLLRMSIAFINYMLREDGSVIRVTSFSDGTVSEAPPIIIDNTLENPYPRYLRHLIEQNGERQLLERRIEEEFAGFPEIDWESFTVQIDSGSDPGMQERHVQ